MKKRLLLLLVSLGICTNALASTDLIAVFRQALFSDPTYQQAIAQTLATQENVPISRSVLLPSMIVTAQPSLTKTHNTGVNTAFSAAADNIRMLNMQLAVTQTVFNYAQFSALCGACAGAKQAAATLNAAVQNLMLRTAQAYFSILQDEDNLTYTKANKDAFYKQLDQIRQQYKVGLKTITDVYTAQAAYDSASATYIAAQTILANDRENLRAITGVYYSNLSKLSETFPLTSPRPTSMEAWVNVAERQNWAIKASQFGVQAACENIKQQFAGHFPTLNAQGSYNVDLTRNTTTTLISDAGTSKNRSATVALNLNLPIFQGGLVVSQTNQARYNYQLALQQLEFTVRSTVNTARQSYLNVNSGILKIQADKQAIKSAVSSLEGLREGYLVGTQTLVDVLNQQRQVYLSQLEYARDRYAYVNNLLALKNAAGTLSVDDLQAINTWLISGTLIQENNPDTTYESEGMEDTFTESKNQSHKKHIKSITKEHSAKHQSKTKTTAHAKKKAVKTAAAHPVKKKAEKHVSTAVAKHPKKEPVTASAIMPVKAKT